MLGRISYGIEVNFIAVVLKLQEILYLKTKQVGFWHSILKNALNELSFYIRSYNLDARFPIIWK